MAPAKRKRIPASPSTAGRSISSARVRCPACQKAVPTFYVNSHLDLECPVLKSTSWKSSSPASNSGRESFDSATPDAATTESLQKDEDHNSWKSATQSGKDCITQRPRPELDRRLRLGFCVASECVSRFDDNGNEAQDMDEDCDSQKGSKASPNRAPILRVSNGGSAHVATEGCDHSRTVADSTNSSVQDSDTTSETQENGEGRRKSVLSATGHTAITRPGNFLGRLPVPQTAPKGLQVLEDFVTAEEEEHLLRCLDADISNPWKLSGVNGIHRGKAYGNHIYGDAKRRVVTQVYAPMPNFLVQYEERMRRLVPALKNFFPNEMNSIDYRKAEGHYLKAHMDDRQLSGTILVNLSLAGTCFMSYTRERGHQEIFRVKLPRRSLQVLTGESRYSYKHGIQKNDILDPRRVSLTFRQSVEVN